MKYAFIREHSSIRKHAFLRCFALLAALFILFSPAARAESIRYLPLGTAPDILGAVAVYCNRWDSVIGKQMGYNMSFDSTDLVKTQDWHNDLSGTPVITFKCDGISFDMDDKQNVYFISLLLNGEDSMTAVTKALAVVSTLIYSFPSGADAMTQRYLNLLTAYNDFMEESSAEIYTDYGYKEWEIPGNNTDIIFSFNFIRERLYFQCQIITFE